MNETKLEPRISTKQLTHSAKKNTAPKTYLANTHYSTHIQNPSDTLLHSRHSLRHNTHQSNTHTRVQKHNVLFHSYTIKIILVFNSHRVPFSFKFLSSRVSLEICHFLDSRKFSKEQLCCGTSYLDVEKSVSCCFVRVCMCVRKKPCV